uniref:uncharacterized protein n=1 Tax=Pristiophorus japonicus TaxID=55135 RepID=UPI00398EB216
MAKQKDVLSVTPLTMDSETTATSQGNGGWCVSTTAVNMTVGGGTYCPITIIDFCFTPKEVVDIQGYIIYPELKGESVNGMAMETIKAGYKGFEEPQGQHIPKLSEEQTKLEQDIHEQRQKYIILMKKIDKLQKDTKEMLANQPWYTRLWNFGLNMQVHPWIKIISQVLVIVQCVVLTVLLIELCWRCKRRARKAIAQATIKAIEETKPLVSKEKSVKRVNGV